MILAHGNIRVEIQQAQPGVSGGVTIYRWQGDYPPFGWSIQRDGLWTGWGRGLWLSLDTWRELAQKVDTVLAAPAKGTD